MNFWKYFALALVLGAALWFLSPGRAIEPNEPGVIEISYLGQAGAEAAVMNDAFRIFEAESREAHQRDPSRPIYRVVTGQNASRDKTADPTRFLVSVAGGMPPDLIRFDRYAVTEWAARGAFTKLDGFVAREAANPAEDAIRPENFYNSAWEEVLYENPINHDRAVFAIPADVDDRGLFYNKDLLKRAGYVDASGEARPPQTWDELAEMAVKLTEHDERGGITRLGFAPNFGNAWLYLYSWMNGGQFMSADRRRCTLSSPPVVQALDWMTRVYDSLGGAGRAYAFQGGVQSGQASVDPGELDPFVQGRVAMKIDGYWSFPETLAQFGRDLNYAVSVPPLPATEIAKGRQPFSWVSGWCYAIPARAHQSEAAWELLRFLCSQRAIQIIGDSERQRLESIGRVYVPKQNANRKINEWLFEHYLVNNPAIQPKVRDGAKLLNDLLQTSPIRPVTPVGQLLFNEQKRATENAIFHKMSPQAALAESERVVQRQLDRVLSPPRGKVVQWRYFLWIYAATIVIGAGIIYRRETWRARKGPTASPVESSRRDAEQAGVLYDNEEANASKARADLILEGTRSRYFRSQWRGGWLCASPWLIGFVIFTGGPILFSIIISFCDYDILNPARFIGLANYRWMFTQDALFWKSIWNTAFMAIGIPLGMALSLGMAMLLNVRIRGVAVWRTFFYLPSIVPAVASSILWIWLLNPNVGFINHLLGAFGIHGPNWLQDEHASKPALILMGLWSSGGSMIIWLAGLKGISTNYYEAAALDGASAWQSFRHITLPLLSPYILFNLIMGLIGTLQIFTQAFIVTQGGPIDSTLFYAYHLFNNAFRFLQMGYASALGWFLFLAVFGLTVLQLKLSTRWVHYEE
ncbi:MAG: sugar transport system permease protein [Spartobacteria bacterium]|nr:sugar transport system permease protein [Spartobacteria bacterium]